VRLSAQQEKATASVFRFILTEHSLSILVGFIAQITRSLFPKVAGPCECFSAEINACNILGNRSR